MVLWALQEGARARARSRSTPRALGVLCVNGRTNTYGQNLTRRDEASLLVEGAKTTLFLRRGSQSWGGEARGSRAAGRGRAGLLGLLPLLPPYTDAAIR